MALMLVLVPAAGICRFAECSANHFVTAGPEPRIILSANVLFIQLIYMS